MDQRLSSGRLNEGIRSRTRQVKARCEVSWKWEVAGGGIWQVGAQLLSPGALTFFSNTHAAAKGRKSESCCWQREKLKTAAMGMEKSVSWYLAPMTENGKARSNGATWWSRLAWGSDVKLGASPPIGFFGEYRWEQRRESLIEVWICASFYQTFDL